MNLDFRQLCFEQFFDKNLDDIVIESNILSENQTLRAKQLILNTQENSERIVNSINTYSDNWQYERIGKVELIALKLGISELIMELTPKKVIISEWVKITDKHSTSKGAKFVNGILDRTFLDENKTRWVIDYKISRHEGGDIDWFIDEQKKRYQPKLEEYAALMKGFGAGTAGVGNDITIRHNATVPENFVTTLYTHCYNN